MALRVKHKSREKKLHVDDGRKVGDVNFFNFRFLLFRMY